MPITTNKNLGVAASAFTILAIIASFATVGQTFTNLTSISNVGLLSLGVTALSGVLSIIGFLLFLIAMYGFSKDYAEPKIFNYVLYGLIASIVIGVVTTAITAAMLLSNLGNVISGPQVYDPQFIQDYVRQTLVPTLIIGAFVSLIPAFFNMLAFNKLADKTGTNLFRTVGKLGIAAAAATIAVYILGAALFYSGILAVNSIYTFATVGSAVSLVAWILGVKAYYSIPVQPPSQSWASPAQAPPSQPGEQAKYCPYCGAANTWSAEYCVRCGRKQ